jgi:hypothetical protein
MSKNTKTTTAFRAGSNMQKGYEAYRTIRRDYLKADGATRRKHAERIAKRLRTTLNSVRTMICKNWEPTASAR